MGLSSLWKKSAKEEPQDTGVLEYRHSGSDDDINPKKANFESTVSADDSSVDTKDNLISRVADPENSAGSKAYNHVFQDPAVAEYWQGLYEETKYESRHLIDPKLTWTPEEEKKVIWKADIHALAWSFIMFVALDIDRYNLANATADGILDDLNMSTNDYNLGNTLYLVFFLISELPSQLLSKAVGTDRFLPTQMCVWSIVAVCQSKIENRAGFLATRAIVGFCEGGFLPEMITWISYFYTHDEFTKRMGWFYVANPLTKIFASLLAVGIQQLENQGGWKGWRYVFLIEGLITLGVGLISFKMPAGPANTRTWFRKKGWFTDREEKIMANRIVRDDPTKGTLNNRAGVTPRMLWDALIDYDMWPLYIDRFVVNMIGTPIGQYFPILLRNMKYTPVQINLLMIPESVGGIITLLATSYLAAKTRLNGPVWFIVPLWYFCIIIPIRWWPGFMENHWATYGLLFVFGCAPPSPIPISWNSINSFSVSRRAVSVALQNMFSQASGIVGSNIFQEDDNPPYYPKGKETVLGLSVAGGVLVLSTSLFYHLRNKHKERKWNSMTVDEQRDYIQNTTDKDNKRLDNRFAL